MATPAAPFIQVVEVWVPDGDEILRYRAGAHGPHAALADATAGLAFKRGQGLPGTAWSERRALIWEELSPHFVRAELAKQAGIDAGVAFPLFRGDELTSVVVLLCGSRGQSGGCVELWEPNTLRELAHAGGYYGSLSQFARLSRLLRFQEGRGLPGITWERGAPHVIPDLAGSTSFLRAAAAREAGVEAGLGIPLYRGREVAQVLLLLSAHATPLARVFELWVPDAAGRLTLSESYYASRRSEAAAGGVPPAGERLAQRVFESALPAVLNHPRAPQPQQNGTPETDFGFCLGLPIHDGERVRAIVTLFS